MTVDELIAELQKAVREKQITGDRPVFLFDMVQPWGIDVNIARHRTGNSIWITRQPINRAQQLEEVLRGIVAVNKAILGSDAGELGATAVEGLTTALTNGLEQAHRLLKDVEKGR